jgi:zinc transporter ZupT
LGAKTSVAALGEWAAVAAGPAAWSATLLGNYLLTSMSCGPQLPALLQALSGLMLVIVVIAGLFSWRRLQTSAAEGGVDQDSNHAFIVHLALLSCAVFAIAIIAQMTPPWILHDCS